MISKKLEFCAKNNFNVLLIGDAGVGKTAVVKEAFNSLGLKWKYFSAATMDPWVDFIGVPKEVIDESGERYLDLIRMKGLDKVEAFFFDELNRSHKKIRNAVMELIQFKSINGHKFPNLKVVWAAINPEDDEETYDVEKLDPAQKDRFHVIVNIPYKADMTYFRNKYGNNGVIAVEWWEKIPKEKKLNILSPRRLDYALEYYNVMGDIRDVLPQTVNVGELLSKLTNDILDDDIDEIFNEKDEERAQELMEKFSTQKVVIESLKNDAKLAFFLRFCDLEYLSSLMEQNKYFQVVLNNAPKNEKFSHIIKNLYNNTKNEMMKNKILLFAKGHTEWASKILGIMNNDNLFINKDISEKMDRTKYEELIKNLYDNKPNLRNDAFSKITSIVGLDINREEIQKLFMAIDFFIKSSRGNTLYKYKKEFEIIDFLMNKAITIWKRKTTLDFFLSLQSIRILKENDIYKNFLD